ncbi:MAG: DUF333 domain-containing protein [Candidatus Aenigmatarchaeota archaeon]
MKINVVVVSFVILAVVLAIVLTQAKYDVSNNGIACTQEAKLCPDGSYVGRTGPNCQFPSCPKPAQTNGGNACTEEAMICPDGSAVGRTGPNCAFAPCPSTQIDNPASVNCVDKGGTLEIQTLKGGEQIGYCILPNGTVCEEWALFRGECS